MSLCSLARVTRPRPSTSLALAVRRSFSSSPAALSHIGSLPIAYPSHVSISSQPPVNSLCPSNTTPARVRVEGPKGRLFVDIMPFVQLVHTAAPPSPSSPSSSPSSPSSLLSVQVLDRSVKHQRAIWGLTRSLLANAVEGVSTGYTLSLRLVGVGYRATLEEIPSASAQLPPSQRLNLKLGFAHPVLIDLPADVVASTPSTTNIVLAGIDKQRLGEVAARIRRWRQPEPYNGKGIFVGDEVVRRKEVKRK